MSELENALDRNQGPGPWFVAARDGACSRCGEDIAEGDEIRADGWGCWEGRCCERVRENEERAEREAEAFYADQSREAAQCWGSTTFEEMGPR